MYFVLLKEMPTFPSDTLVIFTTSPTGLGHIRVTKALINGLPSTIPYHIVGINDPAIEGIYRLMSTNPFLRRGMEFFQTNQLAEKLQTQLFTKYEQTNIQRTTDEIKFLLTQYPDIKKLIIVSTHAQLARRIQSIIDQKRLPIPAVHAVIVTDDSPQRLWAVCAPLVIVPSEHTRDELSKLFVCDRLHKGSIEVAPYPIDPILTEELAPPQWQNRLDQCNPASPEPLHIAIPISGAAVQLDFMEDIITYFATHKLITNSLTHKLTKKLVFSIIAKSSPYSADFLKRIAKFKNVNLLIGETNEETVDLYNHVYCNSAFPPAIEITKPSEQAFKALTPPTTIGGSLLLLSEPVGRQEYDNINYLERAGYLGTRALDLPNTPDQAIEYLKKALKSKIFLDQCTKQQKNQNNGVNQIWKQIIFHS